IGARTILREPARSAGTALPRRSLSWPPPGGARRRGSTRSRPPNTRPRHSVPPTRCSIAALSARCSGSSRGPGAKRSLRSSANCTKPRARAPEFTHACALPRVVGEGSLSSAHRRVEGAAVEQQVLPDDKSGRRSAQKGAGIAELLGIANPARRVRRPALPQHLLERDILTPRLVFDAGAQPVRQER